MIVRLSDLFFTKQKLFQRGVAVTELVEPSQNGFFKSLRNIERSWITLNGRFCVYAPKAVLEIYPNYGQFFLTFEENLVKNALFRNFVKST